MFRNIFYYEVIKKTGAKITTMYKLYILILYSREDEWSEEHRGRRREVEGKVVGVEG